MNARQLRELAWTATCDDVKSSDREKAYRVMRLAADLVEACDAPKADSSSKARALYHFNKSLKETT